jgi:hypothetical protein
VTTRPVADKNWAGRDYNQPGPRGPAEDGQALITSNGHCPQPANGWCPHPYSHLTGEPYFGWGGPQHDQEAEA